MRAYHWGLFAFSLLLCVANLLIVLYAQNAVLLMVAAAMMLFTLIVVVRTRDDME